VLLIWAKEVDTSCAPKSRSQKKGQNDEQDGDEEGTVTEKPAEDKAEAEKKGIGRTKGSGGERREILTPASPGAAKRQKEMTLEGKRTVA
jgi:hypothetical protein